MANSLLTRRQLFRSAKIANDNQRYKDAINYMNDLVTKYVSLTSELTKKERNMLSGAYENFIGPLRSAWQTVSTLDRDGEFLKGHNPMRARQIAQDYRTRLEAEISKVCNVILKLLDEILIPSASSSESKVLYLKMEGDYKRYLVDFKVGVKDRTLAAVRAKLAYETAEKIALADLRPLHPMRLGVALNFSAFFRDVLNESEAARTKAKVALSDAVEDMMDSLRDEESKHIMQLLRENLNL
ncbi:hypothetical protein ACH5RR_020794 [Cinchona calisaya]|uniref:14-3-3 domain-containing protein n=1 Tax=Cinchona calisaya TaxID=153742 RepID=A0ABD2ZIZ3_9GENT